MNLRGQPLPPQPGLKQGGDAFHPGAHAAWLGTPAPPGLSPEADAVRLGTPAPPGLRPAADAAWLGTPAPPGLGPEAEAAWLESAAPLNGGPERVVVIRNETNRGFPAGCNQGLTRARGRYIVLLNNDTIVTAGWLDGLIACSLYDWPKVGMAGAVTNYSRQPQQIPVDYADVGGIDAFAAKRRRDFAGQALQVARLTGFCVLLRREVLDHIGGFDERYGLGFFDDDDLSVRARRAGFQLFVALGVFVHHFGSRTFASLGVDAHKQLQANFEQRTRRRRIDCKSP